ncbi:MAG: YVTN family beta-propeller protein [Verrucomicrobiales bacterium]|jgi:YVTN family beta-propeller protein
MTTKTKVGLFCAILLGFPSGNLLADTFAIVANSSDSTCSIIDTNSESVVYTIEVGALPLDVQSSPDGATVYVSVLNSSAVDVLDLDTGEVTASIPIPSNPAYLAISSDGSALYVSGGDRVYAVDLTDPTYAISGAVEMPKRDGELYAQPRGMTLSPDNSTLYVVNNKSSLVAVVDTLTMQVIETIDFLEVGTVCPPNRGLQIAMRPDGQRAYVTTALCRTKVIDTATNTILVEEEIPVNGSGIEISSDGAFAYIASTILNTSGDAFVAQVDLESGAVTELTIPGTPPYWGASLALSPDESKIYVTQYQLDQVSIIDLDSGLVNSVTVGDNPVAVDFAILGSQGTVVDFESFEPSDHGLPFGRKRSVDFGGAWNGWKVVDAASDVSGADGSDNWLLAKANQKGKGSGIIRNTGFQFIEMDLYTDLSRLSFAETVEVTAYFLDGGTLSTEIVLADQVWATVRASDLGVGGVMLTSIRFNAGGTGKQNTGNFGIDNFTLNFSDLP